MGMACWRSKYPVPRRARPSASCRRAAYEAPAAAASETFISIPSVRSRNRLLSLPPPCFVLLVFEAILSGLTALMSQPSWCSVDQELSLFSRRPASQRSSHCCSYCAPHGHSRRGSGPVRLCGAAAPSPPTLLCKARRQATATPRSPALLESLVPAKLSRRITIEARQ